MQPAQTRILDTSVRPLKTTLLKQRHLKQAQNRNRKCNLQGARPFLWKTEQENDDSSSPGCCMRFPCPPTTLTVLFKGSFSSKGSMRVHLFDIIPWFRERGILRSKLWVARISLATQRPKRTSLQLYQAFVKIIASLV